MLGVLPRNEATGKILCHVGFSLKHTHSLSRSLCLSLSLTHTQMGEIRDVQRDLDARSDQHRTGILGEDVWLQQQLQRGESTGGRSAACVLQ